MFLNLLNSSPYSDNDGMMTRAKRSRQEIAKKNSIPFPRHIRVLIYSFFPLSDLVHRIGLVCKQSRQEMPEGYVLRVVDYLNQGDIATKELTELAWNCSKLARKHIQPKHLFENVLSLKISHLSLNKFCLIQLFSNSRGLFPEFPSLEHLQLTECKNTLSFLSSLTHSPHQLQFLSIQDSTLSNLTPLPLSTFTELKHLKLANIPSLRNETLTCLHSLTNLSSLHLRQGKEISDVGLTFLSKLTKLTDFVISHASVTATTIQAFPPSLRHLTIEHCDSISGNSLQRLPTNLLSLSLLETPNIFNDPLLNITHLSSLEHLAVQDCTLSDEAMTHIAPLTTINKLILVGCTALTDTGFQHLTSLTKINHLDLADCPELTDDSIERLNKFPNLTFVNLSGCSGITDEGLPTLDPTILTRLTQIYLADCPEVTKKGLSLLKRVANLDVFTHLS